MFNNPSVNAGISLQSIKTDAKRTSANVAKTPRVLDVNRDDSEVSINIRFHPLAYAMVVLFFFMIVIPGLVTSYDTEYNFHKDAVHRFYDTFSLCSLFDHYPANVVAIVPFMLFSLVSLVTIFVTFMYVYLQEDIWLLLTGAIALTMQVICELQALNIFTANLYDNDSKLVDAQGRPIHLDNSNVDSVLVHTSFYWVWLLGHLIGMLFLWHLKRHVRNGRLRWYESLAALVLVLVSVLALAEMLVYAVSWEPGTGTGPSRIDATDGIQSPSTVAQHFLSIVTRPLRLEGWHFVPIFLYRFALPFNHGVSFRFRTAGALRLKNSTRPENFISSACIVLAIAFLLSFLFADPERDDDTRTRLMLATSFRKKPFNFVFVPIWTLVTLMFIFAVVCQLARTAILQHDGWNSLHAKVSAFVGISLSLCMVLAVWLVIPEFDTGGYQAYPILFLLPIWFFLSHGVSVVTIVYNVLLCVCMGLTVLSDDTAATVFNLILVVLLALSAKLPSFTDHWLLLGVELIPEEKDVDDDEGLFGSTTNIR